MTQDLLVARQRLHTGKYTCVLCRGEEIITDDRRGIMPLLCFLDSGQDLRGFCAADKVVGKAAAFVYCCMGISELYAPVVSAAAAEVLKAKGISVYSDVTVPAIMNRAQDGFCPMESAVKNTDDPQEALRLICKTLKDLQVRTK